MEILNDATSVLFVNVQIASLAVVLENPKQPFWTAGFDSERGHRENL